MPRPTSRKPDRPGAPERMRAAARESLQIALRQKASAYRRENFLRSFHRLTPAAIAAETPEAAAAVLRELERALRAERARAGHWTYDLTRHIALLVAYRAKQARASSLVARRGGAPTFVRPAGLG
ncbi:hypothetical protein [Methylosinus sp. Ce-a6]|uniref:hypothetical protein n=1 Tax=Methylosinus sp. Ce-a6 TaxID=2172005 RepID=UPI001FCF113A|nr:hypothetical protein [Methylosinus sp. Ce-a6]